MRTSILFLSVLALLPARATAQTPDLSSALRWRTIGPFRAGRARALAGTPGHPTVFYIGFDNGGLWRSSDYGNNWEPLFDREATGSIGAIAVAPSAPNVIYVGTGAGIIRPDLATGNGMYRSNDTGRTWTQLGLEATQMIAYVDVDPTNPDRLFVAALGHPYGPNAERGIYRSTDGGRTFEKVLYKDEYTSGNEVRIDPSNPNTVYATLWQQQSTFYEYAAFGPDSTWPGAGGIYKSTDGGTTWTQLGGGLPPVLEANIAIAPSNPQVIYTMVASVNPAGGSGPVSFYKSSDGGAHWTLRTRIPGAAAQGDTTAATADARPLGRIGGGDLPPIVVDPKNENVIYSASIVMWRTEDGGTSWSAVRGSPGGDDYQRIWIHPDDPNLILAVSDQGAVISGNRGASWSNWYTQPTAAVYHVTADSNGNASASFVLQSQSGNYSSYAIDDGTGTRSNSISYTVNGTAHSSPTISSIAPTTPVTGNIDQDVAVYGSNFQPNLTVSVGFPGGGGTTLSGAQIGNVTSSSFVMHVTLNGAGTWSMRVNNPDGGQSSPFNLSVINASVVPSISSVQPVSGANSVSASGGAESLVAASAVQNLTVTGTNFRPALTVDALFPTGQTITLQGPNQILNLSPNSFTLNIALPYSGTYSIRVKNPDGGQSNSYPFPIGSFDSQTCSVTLPDRFSQREGGWEGDNYGPPGCTNKDGTRCKISGWGCNMTSLAMDLKSNGVDTDPRRLNLFMTTHTGYDGIGNVIHVDTIVSMISDPALHLADHPLKFVSIMTSSTQKLKELLCNGFPVRVGVNPSYDKKGRVVYGHFVLVTGMQGDKFLIADPWCTTADSKCQINDTSRTLYDVYYKSNFPNNWFQTRGYITKAAISGTSGSAGYRQSYSINDSADNSTLNISVRDSAELLLIDPSGRRTGFDPVIAGDVEEIPNAVYFRDSISDADTGDLGTHAIHSFMVSQPAAGAVCAQEIKREFRLIAARRKSCRAAAACPTASAPGWKPCAGCIRRPAGATK